MECSQQGIPEPATHSGRQSVLIVGAYRKFSAKPRVIFRVYRDNLNWQHPIPSRIIASLRQPSCFSYRLERCLDNCVHNRVHKPVSRWKRCGVIVVVYEFDHDPRHAHIFEDGRRPVRFDIESWTAMDGKLSPRARKAMNVLREEGKFDSES